MKHIHNHEKSGIKQLTTIIFLGALSACGLFFLNDAIEVATAPPPSATPAETPVL